MVLRPLHSSCEGAPAYPPLVMFKIVLLQRWYSHSDPAAEEAVRDRLSFRRFCGVPVDEETPDHSSIWRFRQRLAKLGLDEALLAEVNRHLDARGLIVKRGTLVDAVNGARNFPTFGERKFPSLAGWAISLRGDQRLRFWAAVRGVSGSPGQARG